MHTLDGLPKELQDALINATDDEKRAICLFFCWCAVKHANLAHPLTEAGLRLLENRIYRDDRLTKALDELVEELDHQYFAAWNRLEAGQGDEETVMRLFDKARAASAVRFAFEDDPRVAVGGALYEACAAIDDEELTIAMLRQFYSKDGRQGSDAE